MSQPTQPSLSPLLDRVVDPTLDPGARARAWRAALAFPRTEEVDLRLASSFPEVVAVQDDPAELRGLVAEARRLSRPDVLATIRRCVASDQPGVAAEARRVVAAWESAEPDGPEDEPEGGGDGPEGGPAIDSDPYRTLLFSVLSTGDPQDARALARIPHPGGLPPGLLEPTESMANEGDDADEVTFWLAVVAARCGRPEALLGFADGSRDGPAFTWGQPEVAYETIASVRPLPGPVLVRILERLGIEDPLDPAQVGRGNLVAWALTGIADVHGVPPQPPRPPNAEPPTPGGRHEPEPPVKRGGGFLDLLAGSASEVVRSLALGVGLSKTDSGPPPERGEAPGIDELLRTEGVIAESLGEELARETAIELGNDIIEAAMRLPPGHSRESAEAIYRRVGASPILDPCQLAALGHRFADLDALVERAAADLHNPVCAEFLRCLGAEVSGRAPSPYRGTGGGVADADGDAARWLSDQMKAAKPPPVTGGGERTGAKGAHPSDGGSHDGGRRFGFIENEGVPEMEDFDHPFPPSPSDAGGETAGSAPDPTDGGSASSSRAKDTGPFTRTPHMDLVGDGPYHPGESVELRVWADLQGARQGEAVAPIVIEAPESVREFPLEVTLVTSAHLDVVGPRTRHLMLRRSEAHSAELAFTVTVRDAAALEAARADGAGTQAGVMAVFSYRTRPSGSVARTLSIEWPSGTSDEEDVGQDEEPTCESALAVDVDALEADLQVTLVRVPGDPPGQFHCTVHSPHVDLGLEPEPWHAGAGRAVIDQVLERFIQAAPERRSDELMGAGYEFFDAAPAAFKRYFWHLVDHLPGFETISIVTNEDTLPWELMVPTRPDPGPHDPAGPLGVEYDIGRWTSTSLRAAPQRIPLGTGLVVAPHYEKDELKWSAEEAELVSRLGTHVLQPATGSALKEALAHDEGGLFHFVGHGHAEGAFQELSLEGERVAHTVLRHWLRTSGYLRHRPTLVVLNACEVGRPLPSVLGSGGIPDVFIREGAAAVLAPTWSVKDSVARDVADRFYAALREAPDTPLPHILRDIRRLSYDDGDDVEDSYAAYCFYGDPQARVVLST